RHIAKEDIIVPPLGIAYLAAVLEEKGYKVSIIDAFAEMMDINRVEDRIKAVSPDVIGITGMTPVIDNALRVARISRKHAKHIVLGGPHVSVVGKKIFEQCPDIDYAVRGEGETIIASLMDALGSGKGIGNVPGIITRDIENPPASFVDNLDSIPFPARHLLPNERYRYILSSGKITTMFTSRGCPYHCIFCDKAVFGSKWRARSAANVLDEIELINRDLRVNSIIFYDDLFTLKKERVIEVCQGILEKGLRIEWKCEGRVNIVDDDVLKLMRRAGCSMIAYGVESGNRKGLDYLNKGTNVAQIKRAFELTRKAGIKPMAYFVLGIPVETYEDELRTIDFAKEIRPAYAQFSVLSPTPGTRLYEDAIRMGWYREVDAQNPMDKDLRRPAIINENWDEDKLNKILREAHRKFYLSPWYILERLREIRSVKEFMGKARAGLKLLKWYLRK
ncbi:MAG: cobalamin B12-binding domain-containing protein, partial [Nitrospirae bacterium]|nr:cobalamin B12-binding domain-containing protein [Nitrospirota bacterium]